MQRQSLRVQIIICVLATLSVGCGSPRDRNRDGNGARAEAEEETECEGASDCPMVLCQCATGLEMSQPACSPPKCELPSSTCELMSCALAAGAGTEPRDGGTTVADASDGGSPMGADGGAGGSGTSDAQMGGAQIRSECIDYVDRVCELCYAEGQCPSETLDTAAHLCDINYEQCGAYYDCVRASPSCQQAHECESCS